LAARLCHPNIVQVFDAGENGRPFLVMEYVDGETIADRLARGAGFSDYELLSLTADLSAGLAHAHAMGIVHRDVKPHNVLLGPDGVAKLTDFGIARAREDHGLTEIGTVLGTAPFMAPEQAAGGPVGPPADVFALGAVLRHIAGDSLPAGLDQLVRAALATEPADRPSAAELNARLSGPNDAAPTVIAEPAPTGIVPTRIFTPTKPADETQRRKLPVPAVAVVALIVLLLVLFPRGNESNSVTPVPAGADPTQTASNLATWLRNQAGEGPTTTGGPR
jgi:hypothetical protein